MRIVACLLLAGLAAPANAQAPDNERGQAARQALEDRFQAFPLKIGDAFPEIDVFDSEGRKFNTRSLKGKYTVIVNGCLT